MLDGDGCSSSCEVEVSYFCHQSPSVCIYRGIPLELTLKYVERNGDNNQGSFVFNIYPPLLFLDKLTSSDIVLGCLSDYTVVESSYSSGQLTLVVDYTTNMEGVNCNISIAYNPATMADISNSSLSFEAISRNEKLIIID
jgi:hypothetical protein